MNTPWHGLLANMAVVALFLSIWSNVPILRWKASPRLRQLGFGLLLGAGALMAMLLPFELEKGVYIDLRTTLVSVAGFFGGPVAVLATAGMAAAYRLYVGGAGVLPGLVGIASAAIVGLSGYFLNKGERPTVARMVLFSAAVSASGMLGLLVVPRAALSPAVPPIFLPVTTIVFIGTLMTAFAVANELRRREIMHRNHIYKMAIDNLPDCLNVKDMEGRFLIANPATAELMKAADVSTLLGRTDFDFYPEETARGFHADEDQVLQAGLPKVVEQKVRHVDGSDGWLSTLKVPFFDEAGQMTGLITHNRDITAKKKLEAALLESERKSNAALTHMADGLIMFDQNLNVVFCNEQYRAMFPLTADLRVPGTPAASILYASIARGELVGIPTENVTEWVNTAMSRLRQAGTVQFPLFDGRWIESRTSPAPDGTCFVVCSDITKGKRDEQALRQLNERLSELAETDGLTGLLNRRAFDAILAEEIVRVGTGEGALSLLLLDVDRFKAFNDTYGHTSGDECLKSIAACMRDVIDRPTDSLARYGGEELVVILPDTSEEGAATLAHELRTRIRSLAIPHVGSEKGIVTASIGVATLQAHTRGLDARRLVMRADEALYAAKAAGRDRVRTWEPAKPQLIITDAG